MKRRPDIFYFSSFEDILKWGKFKKYTLGDAIDCDPTYLYWCANNIPEFSLSLGLIEEIRQLYPSFILPINLHKDTDELEYDDEDYGDYEDDAYEEEEEWEKPTYERYAGSWAQEVEGYSDDDIDTIFDGDPDAYWNID